MVPRIHSLKYYLALPLLFLFFFAAKAQQTPFEEGNGNQSTTYEECIAFYDELDAKYENVKRLTYGRTDCGEPLSLVVVSNRKVPDRNNITSFIREEKDNDKAIFLVMNGIHPGEPDGIDASMMMVRDMLESKDSLLKSITLCVIPVYNIGGALNRNSYSRANQNGPEFYGFRGNAKNLDLNRDFIKSDSKNTWAFYELFHHWRPDVFLDNHVSNGADYQYTMTLIESQIDRQDFGVRKFQMLFVPELYAKMADKGEEMVPYVNVHGRALDSSISAFFESPRYSTGFTSLFGCMSFVAETHMLKPFDERVKATYTLMRSMMELMATHRDDLLNRNVTSVIHEAQLDFWPIRWELDKSTFEMLNFKGYEYEYRESAIPGHKRLYYNQKKKKNYKLRYYNRYSVTDSVNKPFAYYIPQAWTDVIKRLIANRALVKVALYDTLISMKGYEITHFEAASSPYEGHFPLSKIQTEKISDTIQVRRGDYFVLLPNRFALETLEPRAHDAFLVWNFFDPILQQKEWFSAYVFEDEVEKILEADPALAKALSEKRINEPDFAKNYWAQLYFIYRHSPYYEKAHLRYPVFHLDHLTSLPIE